MRCSTRLAPQKFDPTAEIRTFQLAVENEGAIVSFIGVARPYSSTGAKVSGLYLDHHPRLTEKSIRDIAEDAVRRFGASALTVVHRCGEIEPGEAIVFIAVAALHRRAAFEAAEYAMDRLKTDAVFWKREDAVDGSRWIEPTIADHVDRGRWSK
jgi:molybdopterin synthase catalytic subunit